MRYTVQNGKRSDLDLVAQSCKPAGGLMEVIAGYLEREGFDLSATDWPRLEVRIGDELLVLGVAGQGREAQQLEWALRQAQRIVSRL